MIHHKTPSITIIRIITKHDPDWTIGTYVSPNNACRIIFCLFITALRHLFEIRSSCTPLGHCLGRHVLLLAQATKAAFQPITQPSACSVAALHTIIMCGGRKARCRGTRLVGTVAVAAHAARGLHLEVARTPVVVRVEQALGLLGLLVALIGIGRFALTLIILRMVTLMIIKLASRSRRLRAT